MMHPIPVGRGVIVGHGRRWNLVNNLRVINLALRIGTVLNCKSQRYKYPKDFGLAFDKISWIGKHG
jgi:hypothetical protein